MAITITISGTNQCNVVQEQRETVNKEDNCRDSIGNVYIVPENQHKHGKKIF